MSRKGIFTGIYLIQIFNTNQCLSRAGDGSGFKQASRNFWSDENVLKLDFSDGYTDLDIY